MNKLEQQDLGDELCEYCPLEKKGVYSVNGGFVAGCEGSRCGIAYDNYLQSIEEQIMNKLETNALRIAELMGYSLDNIDFKIASKELFAKYNGLMPIVFECNVDINYRIHIYEECVIFSTADGEMLLPKLNYNTEPEFIEAIQLACIKYLELKDD